MKNRIQMGLVIVSLLSASVGLAANSVTVAVEGMTCASCMRKVEKQLKALPQVSSVKMQLDKGSAVVSLKDQVSVDETLEVALKAAVKKAGYEAKSIR